MNFIETFHVGFANCNLPAQGKAVLRLTVYPTLWKMLDKANNVYLAST